MTLFFFLGGGGCSTPGVTWARLSLEYRDLLGRRSQSKLSVSCLSQVGASHECCCHVQEREQLYGSGGFGDRVTLLLPWRG